TRCYRDWSSDVCSSDLLGVVDGRNIWRTEFDRALALIERGVQALGSERLLVGPACSLLHIPVDLAQEARLDDELRQWLAFAQQKIGRASCRGGVVARGW